MLYEYGITFTMVIYLRQMQATTQRIISRVTNLESTPAIATKMSGKKKGLILAEIFGEIKIETSLTELEKKTDANHEAIIN